MHGKTGKAIYAAEGRGGAERLQHQVSIPVYVDVVNGKVHMNFMWPTLYIGLDPAGARSVAKALNELADKVDAGLINWPEAEGKA